MVLSHIFSGLKDEVIVVGAVKALERLEDEFGSDDVDSVAEAIEVAASEEDYDSKSLNTVKGGENMTRKPNDPDDLGRQTRDARGSEYEMFDALEEFNEYLEEVFEETEEEVELTVEDSRDIIRYLENEIVSESLSLQERNYDRVSAFVVQELGPAVADHYDSVETLLEEARDFRDESDYEQVENELSTMERRGQDFEDKYDLDL